MEIRGILFGSINIVFFGMGSLVVMEVILMVIEYWLLGGIFNWFM